MPTIRRIKPEQYDITNALSEYAFQYKLDEATKQKRFELWHEQDIWGDFEGNTMISKLHVYPLQLWINGESYEMGGVAAVATWPEHRRKQSVSRLLTHSLAYMMEKGQTISLLHPFKVSFYRKFGWELFVDQKWYTLSLENLHPMQPANGTIARFPHKEAIYSMQHIYRQFATRYNGTLNRSDKWLERQFVKEGTYTAVYTNHHGDQTGYLVARVRDEKMTVTEWVALDQDARRGLWNFICQHDSMVKEVEMVMTADDTLAFEITNPIFTQKTVPYFMARIVDVEAFFSKYIAQTSESAPVTLTVEDPYAPWNEGNWRIEGTSIVKVPSGETSELEVDIQTLSALALGYITAEQAHDQGRLRGERLACQKFARYLTTRQTAFLDYF
ncbi:GNAT family N-acetyltransferase [Bacillus fonticola]|uniref:GNAT family N-acetyltransferase n=1 Tax=Bacillus fonticola TaxID=2728853 RepID=UPI0014745B76|nr:GNAT family N-acetyltransferase [Bacillus fonticola]